MTKNGTWYDIKVLLLIRTLILTLIYRKDLNMLVTRKQKSLCLSKPQRSGLRLA